ncbi:MAG TPA: hypothetical protein VHY84_04075 [Bryobacteraceae bacterium]|jgi:hypothetical protein|nr:hypothetical protein [Bryobacteraceae bacterium]
MQIKDFKAIVMAFADPGTELLFDQFRVVISVNGDLIEATIAPSFGDIYVDEGSGRQPASKWILNRLARLPLLASRLRETVAPTEFFVSPSALLEQTPESGPQEKAIATDDALPAALRIIDERSPLETTVMYITSDAGEGKTSLINELARTQAKRFLENSADWLLVPIPLGGRHFLRFDDITVGALQNRYRFPFLYYNSFLALVRMGVIVPAFDGFEEMFVESSSGEALSAMGVLVGALESQGAVVVAARRAYFEFENLRTQQRLSDTIRSYSVGFGKLELKRWTKTQFIAYCEKRAINKPEELFRRISERLPNDHPILTRAVLVKRLVDLAVKSPSLDEFLTQVQHSGADYFSVFVRSLIEREANEKWIDRSGEKEVATSLLSVEEHCDLLSQIALAMWEARVDYLKLDSLAFVAEYFGELNRKNAFQIQQIRERIRGHAMLIPSSNAAQAVEFDHDEFRVFFLGEAIAQQVLQLTDRAKADVLSTVRRGPLPQQAQDALARALMRHARMDRVQLVRFLLDVCRMDSQASYTQENCSALVIRMLSGAPPSDLVVTNLAFAPEALLDKQLSAVTFKDCYFGSSSIEHTKLSQCSFVGCAFAQLRGIEVVDVSKVTFDRCTVESLLLNEDREIWDPGEIRFELERAGVAFTEAITVPVEPVAEPEADPEFRDFERIVRYFMRSTHMSESVMLMKLGGRGPNFIDKALPRLIRHGIMREIDNHGGGEQRRFRRGVPFERLTAALAIAHGSFSKLLEQFQAVS